MSRFRAAIAPIAVAGMLGLAACTQFALVAPEQPVTLGGTYLIDPQIAWSKLSSGPRESWTVDGPLLNQVRFYNGLIGGSPLREVRVTKPDPMPLFRPSMSPLEIRDFVVASFARDNQQNIATENLRPFAFGPDPGFRFEYSYTAGDGLKKKGFVVGAVHDRKLFLIVYSAPAIYYYDRYRDTVEKMVASLRIT